MRVLQEEKAKGRCRFIGITGNSAEETTHLLHHIKVDTFLMAYSYDLIWREARRESIGLAQGKGAILILGAPFHGGRLAEPRHEWLASAPGMTPEIRGRIERLYSLQKESGLSLVSLAIRYLMAEPSVVTILVGAETPVQVEECVSAAQQGTLPTDLHQAVEELGLP